MAPGAWLSVTVAAQVGVGATSGGVRNPGSLVEFGTPADPDRRSVTVLKPSVFDAVTVQG